MSVWFLSIVVVFSVVVSKACIVSNMHCIVSYVVWNVQKHLHISVKLHYCTATSSWVIVSINFKLIPINKVNVWFPLPFVGHLGYGDQLNSLTLKTKKLRHLAAYIYIYKIHVSTAVIKHQQLFNTKNTY